jgi:tetratricopeptide (TPR) repeat protein
MEANLYTESSKTLDSLPVSGIPRVDALLVEAAALTGQAPQQALLYCREALQLATNLDYKTGQAQALWSMGKCKATITKPDDALDDFYAALEIFEAGADVHGMFRTLNSLAVALSKIGRFAESIKLYDQALAISEQIGDPHSKQIALRNLGLAYDKQGEYSLAVNYLRQSITIARAHNLELATARGLHSLGETYYSLGDYTAALEHLLEAARLSRRFTNDSIYSLCLGSIGLVYIKLGKMTSALDYMMQLLNRAEREGHRLRQARTMFNIGHIYTELGSISCALNYYLKCLRICENHNDKFGEAETLRSLAGLFLRLGDLPEALAYVKQALALCEAIRYRFVEAQTWLTLGQVYAAMQEYEAAVNSLQHGLALATELEGSQEITVSIHQMLSDIFRKTGDKKKADSHEHLFRELEKAQTDAQYQEQAFRMIQNFEEQKARTEAEELGISLSKYRLPDAVFATAYKDEFDISDTTPAADTSRLVTVTTFGRFSVAIGSRELTAKDWQRKKARDIFKLLLINYRKAVSIDEITELLWSDASGKNIVPTIWNSVSYIRKALEPGIKSQTLSSYIRIIDKSYLLDLGEDAAIDFHRFRQIIEEAQRTRNKVQKRPLLEQAVSLYTGDFLKEDTYEEWSCFERESLKGYYLEALMELAGICDEQGDTDRAITLARKAIEADHTYEEGYELILTTLVDRDQKAEAHKIMKQCREAFRKELGSPAPGYLEALLAG